LAALSELESLNLYGNEVTDALLAKLATLPKLKKLYLWQTKVTEEGVKKLKEALPECEVILGVE
jgi:Leucine-rich repeat (LRR) protein